MEILHFEKLGKQYALSEDLTWSGSEDPKNFNSREIGGIKSLEGVVTRLCLVRVGYFRDISYRSSGGFCGYPSEMCGAGVLC